MNKVDYSNLPLRREVIGKETGLFGIILSCLGFWIPIAKFMLYDKMDYSNAFKAVIARYDIVIFIIVFALGGINVLLESHLAIKKRDKILKYGKKYPAKVIKTKYITGYRFISSGVKYVVEYKDDYGVMRKYTTPKMDRTRYAPCVPDCNIYILGKSKYVSDYVVGIDKRSNGTYIDNMMKLPQEERMAYDYFVNKYLDPKLAYEKYMNYKKLEADTEFGKEEEEIKNE